MSADWYQRKLGQQAAPPQRRESTPPTFAPLPQQRQEPHNYQQPTHPAAPNYSAPDRFDVSEYWKQLDPNSAEGKEQRRALLLNSPKPGAGNRDAQTCPNCGGGNYYSRSSGPGINSRRPPSPQCFECGYPLVQSGSVGGTPGQAGMM